MDSIKCGELIKELRQSKNMTQEDLSQIVHVSRVAVSKWERGLSMPDISILETLADTLGISVTELIRGERTSEIEPESETNYRNLSNGAKRELTTMRHKTIWISVAVTVAVVLIFYLGIVYRLVPPVLTLQSTNGYGAVYDISNQYWEITEYWQKNGELTTTTYTGKSVGSVSEIYLNMSEDDGMGMRTNIPSTSEFMNGNMSSMVAMNWVDKIKIDSKDQIIGADKDHSLDTDLHELLKDSTNDYCIITASLKNGNVISDGV